MTAFAAQTRRTIFRDIPQDILVHVDAPNIHGWNRCWYAMIPFGDRIVEFPVLTQSYLTTPTGSLQNTTGGVDATWNNSNNRIETVGAGGSGGIVSRATGRATGGGAGAYSKIANFTIASPGSSTFNWQIGTGGSSTSAATTSSAGAAGGNTWWNDTAFNTGTTNAECSAAGGGAGQQSTSTSANGGTAGTTGWGQTINAGGRGGNSGTSTRQATGGGGAGGPNAAGNQGVDAASSAVGTNGGQGDGTSGGAAGTGGSTSGTGAGGAGTELGDGVHGCGGGAGGIENSVTTTLVAQAGGNYGAGGGGVSNANASGASTNGAGAQGIIVLTWTPGAATKHPNLLPLLGAGMIVSSQFNRRQLMTMIALLRGIRL